MLYGPSHPRLSVVDKGVGAQLYIPLLLQAYHHRLQTVAGLRGHHKHRAKEVGARQLVAAVRQLVGVVEVALPKTQIARNQTAARVQRVAVFDLDRTEVHLAPRAHPVDHRDAVAFAIVADPVVADRGVRIAAAIEKGLQPPLARERLAVVERVPWSQTQSRPQLGIGEGGAPIDLHRPHPPQRARVDLDVNVQAVLVVEIEAPARDFGVAIAAPAVEIDQLPQVALEKAALETRAFAGPHRRAQRLVFYQPLAAMRKDNFGDFVLVGLAVCHLAQPALG